jgi:hypothetical protein
MGGVCIYAFIDQVGSLIHMCMMAADNPGDMNIPSDRIVVQVHRRGLRLGQLTRPTMIFDLMVVGVEDKLGIFLCLSFRNW